MQSEFPGTREENGVTPLPPVTTQWHAPTAAEEGEALLAPFVPGGPARQAPAAWAAQPPGASLALLAPPFAPESFAPDFNAPPAEAAAAGSEQAGLDETVPAESEDAGESRVEPWQEEPASPAESGLAAAAPPEEAATPADEDAWAEGLPEDAGRAAPPWADEREEADQAAEAAEAEAAMEAAAAARESREFPLDAFIIPEHSRRLPAGLELSGELQDQIAEEVAEALEQMVAKLRSTGLDALLAPAADHEPVDVVLAAVLSGYLSRRAR